MTYNRPPSPGSRRMAPPGRTSAASFFPSSTGYSDYPAPTRTSRDYAPASRISNERIDAPRVVRQRSPPRGPRGDDYEVRPRVRTLSLDPGEPAQRRPVSLMAPRSPNRGNARPVVTREVERPSSPLAKSGGAQLEASYVIPASSSLGGHHHRHSSFTTGDRLPIKAPEGFTLEVRGPRTCAHLLRGNGQVSAVTTTSTQTLEKRYSETQRPGQDLEVTALLAVAQQA